MTTETDPLDLSEWPILFPGDDSNIYGSVYSGTFSALDSSQVADITPDRIARVDRSYVNGGDYAETDLAALVELVDGGWATVVAWCDTTGWDCQSGVMWKWAPDRATAIAQGLDNGARERMGLSL
jgi:hypothetical protein